MSNLKLQPKLFVIVILGIDLLNTMLLLNRNCITKSDACKSTRLVLNRKNTIIAVHVSLIERFILPNQDTLTDTDKTD